ncbi:hypothetical protein HanXRQr2_Chr15g0690681 [Helianthus annuus]|uniref:Uncharacterized protein n=1 Tax=Helianthus annuus TaxID=4232 RepID=A0A251SCL1_HELAN|nr:hypothetical protein HanXRQr2_Chr15g0690681 [Helianthus annuus]KAJ0831045.1 hypothetical protein HanPSC8_Chr15g0662501 [Helianthus annuus]
MRRNQHNNHLAATPPPQHNHQITATTAPSPNRHHRNHCQFNHLFYFSVTVSIVALLPRHAVQKNVGVLWLPFVTV